MLPSHIQSVIAKAHQYAAEPDRLVVATRDPFVVRVHGVNAEHVVRLRDGRLACDCRGYARDQWCAHVFAVDLAYPDQLPRDAVVWPTAAAAG
jgi:hypothetical protein